MGEAKRRGDYQKRKAEAIAAGRVKVQRPNRLRLLSGPEILASILSLFPVKVRNAKTETKNGHGWNRGPREETQMSKNSTKVQELTVRESIELAEKYPINDNIEQCGRSCGRYLCTREIDHAGEHVAHGTRGPVAKWGSQS